MATDKEPSRALAGEDRPTPGSALSRRSKLRRRFRGYERAAVDALLDAAAGELEAAEAEQRRLREEVASLQAERDEQRELESLLRDSIVSAERAAREQRERTERDCERLLQEAVTEAAEIRASANAQRRRIQKRIAELERVEQSTRERCRRLLREGLEQIDAAEYREIPAAPSASRERRNSVGAEPPSLLEALRALGRRQRTARTRRSWT